MLPLSLRSNAGSFGPSQMLTSSCGRNSSKSIMIKRCHIYWRLVICIMPLSLEQLWCVLTKPSMLSAKAVSPIKSLYISPLPSAPTAPICTLLAMTTAPCRVLSARAVIKKVTGMQSAAALVLPACKPLSPMEVRSPPLLMLWKGEESWYGCNTYKLYLPQVHWGVNQTLIWSQLTMLWV